jgi:hypothetical protein
VSALLDLAKPRRIKASHRRRRKCASGHRVYIMNNPLSGTDPTGYSCDPMTGSMVCGTDSGAQLAYQSAQGGAAAPSGNRTISTAIRGSDGYPATYNVSVTTDENGTNSYTQGPGPDNGAQSQSVTASTQPTSVPIDSINYETPTQSAAWDAIHAAAGTPSSDGVDAFESNYDPADARSLLKTGAGYEQDAVELVAFGGEAKLVDGTGAAAGSDAVLFNRAGREYPSVLNPGTGKPIPFPSGKLEKVAVSDRVPWGAQERGDFIKQWYKRGYSTPPGGWSEYDIHHVLPREYGGTNAFENLVPVERDTHQSEFNAWWRDR